MKSSPALAVPSSTVYFTEAGPSCGALRTTVMSTVPADCPTPYCQEEKWISLGVAKGAEAA